MSEIRCYGTLITRDVVTKEARGNGEPSAVNEVGIEEFADFMLSAPEMSFNGPWETLYRKADLIILYQSQTKTIMTLQRA